MRKNKYPGDLKIEIAKAYINGEGSYDYLASKYGVGHKSVETWARMFREHGEGGFVTLPGNRSYSSEFKTQCVEEVLAGLGSVDDVIAKHGITSRSVLIKWIEKYRANIELRDYYPRREVYMAGARRKTTIEERREIVKFCLEHDRDYKGTASVYDVSYQQVYDWVKKYDANGEAALADRRGHHKSDDEVDELERLRRENQRLKRQLEEKDMLVELLKKVKEFERM